MDYVLDIMAILYDDNDIITVPAPRLWKYYPFLLCGNQDPAWQVATLTELVTCDAKLLN